MPKKMRGRPKLPDDEEKILINIRVLKSHVLIVDKKKAALGYSRSEYIQNFFRKEAGA